MDERTITWLVEENAMKTVWMLNHYAAEPGGVGGTRHFHLAEGLVKHGWESIIIASSIELNSGRQRLHPGEMKRLDDCNGVRFLWVRVPQYAGNGGGRMRNMLSYSARVLTPSFVRGLPRPDAVIGSSVHPFAAVAGALLAQRFRVPFIFEVRDLWPQTLIDLGRLRQGSFVAKAMAWIERWLYRRAAKIITLLPRAVDYIAPLGIDSGKIVWIPNGVDLSLFPVASPMVEDEGKPFTLMYFGAHGQANALETLVDAMALVRARAPERRILLRLIGDGPAKADLVSRAAGHRLDEESIVFEAPVPKRRIPELAVEADAFVLSVLDRPTLYRYGISMNKLFDYLAAARPIVIASAAVNNPVDDAACGLTVRPGDPGTLAEAIIAISELDIAERQSMGERGRKHVENNYSYTQLATRLSALLDDCVSTWRRRA